jgi:hypothetical protein
MNQYTVKFFKNEMEHADELVLTADDWNTEKFQTKARELAVENDADTYRVYHGDAFVCEGKV